MTFKHLMLLSSLLGTGTYVMAAEVEPAQTAARLYDSVTQIHNLVAEIQKEVDIKDPAVSAEAQAEIRKDLWKNICRRAYPTDQDIENPLVAATLAIFDSQQPLGTLSETITQALVKAEITGVTYSAVRRKDVEGINYFAASSRYGTYHSLEVIITLALINQESRTVQFTLHQGYLDKPIGPSVMESNGQESQTTYDDSPVLKTGYTFYRAPWYSNRVTGGDYAYGFEFYFPRGNGSAK